MSDGTISNRSFKRRVARIVVLAGVIGIVNLTLRGCGRRGPADSADPAFATPAARVDWMTDRLRIAPPSPMRDAHFCELKSDIPDGHMGPGYTMWWLFAKVELADPSEAAKWAAASKPTPPGVGWRRDLNPLHGSTAKWSITPAEFDTVTWYDPAPLLGTSAHGGYVGGNMLIPADGSAVYLWQHWR